jgi:hypothetical protein
MSALRFLALILGGVIVAGCVAVPTLRTLRGSGNTVTNEYNFDGFTRVEVGSAFQVEIVQAESYSVSVTVDDNIEEHLDVSKSGDTLRIRLEPMVRLGFNNVTLKARIALPTLEGLELSGATTGDVSGFNSDLPFDVDVSGASTLRGDISAGATRINASGASTVRLQGQAGSLDVVASGASTADLEDFVATDVQVEASGASRAIVNVNGRLNAEASGASSVRYVGETTSVKVDTSGASSIEEK